MHQEDSSWECDLYVIEARLHTCKIIQGLSSSCPLVLTIWNCLLWNKNTRITVLREILYILRLMWVAFCDRLPAITVVSYCSYLRIRTIRVSLWEGGKCWTNQIKLQWPCACQNCRKINLARKDHYKHTYIFISFIMLIWISKI